METSGTECSLGSDLTSLSLQSQVVSCHPPLDRSVVLQEAKDQQPQPAVSIVEDIETNVDDQDTAEEETSLETKYSALVLELETIRAELAAVRSQLHHREVQHSVEVAELQDKLSQFYRGLEVQTTQTARAEEAMSGHEMSVSSPTGGSGQLTASTPNPPSVTETSHKSHTMGVSGYFIAEVQDLQGKKAGSEKDVRPRSDF